MRSSNIRQQHEGQRVFLSFMEKKKVKLFRPQGSLTYSTLGSHQHVFIVLLFSPLSCLEEKLPFPFPYVARIGTPMRNRLPVSREPVTQMWVGVSGWSKSAGRVMRFPDDWEVSGANNLRNRVTHLDWLVLLCKRATVWGWHNKRPVSPESKRDNNRTGQNASTSCETSTCKQKNTHTQVACDDE